MEMNIPASKKPTVKSLVGQRRRSVVQTTLETFVAVSRRGARAVKRAEVSKRGDPWNHIHEVNTEVINKANVSNLN